MEAQHKEVQRLTRALERSDHYIEGLHQQLQGHQDFTKHNKTHNQASSVHTSTLPLYMNDLGVTNGSDSISSNAKDQQYRSEVWLSHQDFLELHIGQEKDRDADSVSDPKLSVKRQLFRSESLGGMELTSPEDEVRSRFSDIKSMEDSEEIFSAPKKTSTSFGMKPCSEVMPEPIMKKTDIFFKLDSSGKEGSSANKVRFSITEKKSDNTSLFDLDMPSPLVPSSMECDMSTDKWPMKKTGAKSLSKYSHSGRNLPQASKKPLQASSSHQKPHENLCVDNSTRKGNVNNPVEKYDPNKMPSMTCNPTWKVDAGLKGHCFEQSSSSYLSEPDCIITQSLINCDKKAESLSEVDMTGFTKRDSLPANIGNNKVTDQERNISLDLEGPSLDDTQTIQTELNDLDISVTPELADCLKLLNRAEKKVYNTDCPALTTQAGTLNLCRVCNTSQNEMAMKNVETTGYKIDDYIHAGGRGLERENFSQIYIPGLAGTMSGWEHGFFSSLRVNPYKPQFPISQLPATRGTVSQFCAPYSALAGQALSTDHEKMLSTSGNLNGKTNGITLFI